MRITGRLDRVGKALAGRTPVDQFHVIEAVPVGRAEGRPPGLYKDGPAGSLAGLLVYDPARGGPVVPDGKLASFGLLIVCGPEYVEPPADMPV